MGLTISLLLAFSSPTFAATNTIQFNRDVRPILSENCFACHGPDKNQRKGKLRLDVREVALDRGAIVPGNPQDSKLVQHIFAKDEDEIMPPPKSRKTLTTAQKELLKEWVVAGAEYEPHWAYIKPRRFEPPTVRERGWIRNPIDAFILHSLEARNIRPSPEADKATLLRRLSLDLVGLPPTPQEVKAFLADTAPGAYERQVDRLLASLHFGERMAVPWLDVVRYADTVGYHGDQNQNVFPYRDYVINAFNQNKPFDQFTVEQVAGDLLPKPSVEVRVATGFNRLNMMTREGGAQPKEYLAKYAADRVRTVSMAWLGSTMGCAECHDHKFDPFSTKDFYQMEAFFADLQQWGVYNDYNYTPNPDLKGFSNDHPFPPEVETDSPYERERIARLEKRIDEISARACGRTRTNSLAESRFAGWRESSLAFLKHWPTGWAAPEPRVTLRPKETNSASPPSVTIRSDASVLFGNQPKENLKFRIPLTNSWLAAIRLEIVPQEVAEEKRPSLKKRNGTAITLAAALKSKDGKETKVPFYFADADHKAERYANGFALIGVKNSWQISTEHGQQTGVWLLDKPLAVRAGDSLVVDLGNFAVASIRVSYSPFAAGDPLRAGGGEPLGKALARNEAGPPADPELVNRTYLLSTQFDPEAIRQIRALDEDIRECRRGRAMSLVAVGREPAVTRVLARGNWQDETGEVVQPAAPHFLAPIPNPDGRRLTRLDLARWLVSPENPLTARTVVNRLWKQFFGTGLSAVVDDLGAQGEWPVQPELLDWLACEFMEPTGAPASGKGAQAPHAWDFKHVVRLMVTSSTYRQDSNQRPDLREVDPNNRLLAGQTPRRLDAEFVRDNALAIAGLLNLDVGGPSFHPYQPPGYYVNLQFPDRDYVAEKDDRQYRRGVYAHWQRTFLQPMMANFDAPSREECVANRIVSNTPQQALTLLNDPTFIEAARVLAANLLVPPGKSDAQRLEAAYQRALARPPRDKEKKSLLSFLEAQRAECKADADASQKLLKVGIAGQSTGVRREELAAWTEVCRVVLNLHETITRY